MLPCPGGKQSCGWKREWASAALHEEETSGKDARRGGWQRRKLLHSLAVYGLQVCGCGRDRGSEGADRKTVRILEQTVRQGAPEGLQAEVVRLWSEEMLFVFLQDSPRCLATRAHRNRRCVLQLRRGGGRGSVWDPHCREGIPHEGRNFSACVARWWSCFCCHLSLPISGRHTHSDLTDLYEVCILVRHADISADREVIGQLSRKPSIKKPNNHFCVWVMFARQTLNQHIIRLIASNTLSAHCLHVEIILASGSHLHLHQPWWHLCFCKGLEHLMWWSSLLSHDCDGVSAKTGASGFVQPGCLLKSATFCADGVNS